MTQPERILQKVIVTELRCNHRDFRFFVYDSKGSFNKKGFFHKNYLIENGMTDLIGYYKPTKRIVFIEIKYGKGVLNDNQKAMHASLSKDQVWLKTCWSVQDVKDFLYLIRLSEQKTLVN